jgi:hypothetical protein
VGNEGVAGASLIKGHTVNARRLKELNQAVKLIADVAERRDFAGDEAKAVLRVVSDYGLALTLLDDYDHQRVSVRNVTGGTVRPIRLPRPPGVGRISTEDLRRLRRFSGAKKTTA